MAWLSPSKPKVFVIVISNRQNVLNTQTINSNLSWYHTVFNVLGNTECFFHIFRKFIYIFLLFGLFRKVFLFKNIAAWVKISIIFQSNNTHCRKGVLKKQQGTVMDPVYQVASYRKTDDSEEVFDLWSASHQHLGT